LFYRERSGPENGADILYLDLQTDGDDSEPVTFLGTPAGESSARLSPDGRYLAYQSDELGRQEIYVRPFPDGAGQWSVSVNGGRQPRWRSDGKELYYVEGTTLLAVSVSTEQGFTSGQLEVLFESPDLAPDGTGAYHVTADGQRFVMIAPVEGDEAEPPTIRVVLNWSEEFRDREQ
jgi:Tol biopolymer transport system component